MIRHGMYYPINIYECDCTNHQTSGYFCNHERSRFYMEHIEVIS